MGGRGLELWGHQNWKRNYLKFCNICYLRRVMPLFWSLVKCEKTQSAPINKAFFNSRHLLFLSQNNGLLHQNKRSVFPNLDQTVVLGEEKQCLELENALFIGMDWTFFLSWMVNSTVSIMAMMVTRLVRLVIFWMDKDDLQYYGKHLTETVTILL